MTVQLGPPKSKENALNRRLRKMIVSALKEKEKYNLVFESIPTLRHIAKKENALTVRIFWILVTLICISFCSYQIVERVVYYLSSPIATEMKYVAVKDYMIPALTICASDTDKMAEILKGKKTCRNKFVDYFYEKQFVEMDLNELWDATNTSSIYLEVAVYINGSRVPDEKIIREPKYLKVGLCENMRVIGSFERANDGIFIKLKRAKEICDAAIYFTFQEPLAEPDLKTLAMFKSGTVVNVYFRWTRYDFLNTYKTPCVDEETFRKCSNDCYKKTLEKSFTCRFPFFPKEVDLPLCKIDDSTHDLYGEAAKTMLQVNFEKDCNCKRTCHQFAIHLNATITPIIPPDYTYLELYIAEDYSPVYFERYSYDMISLLSDIGGNLGLYLGLSILSGIQLLYGFKPVIKRSKKHVIFKAADPLFKKVLKEIKNQQLNEKLKKNTSVMKIINIIVLLICWLVCCYLIINRIMYYFTYPISISMEMIANSSVRFPDIITCGDSPILNVLKQSYAKKFKIHGNVCDLNLYDMLDFQHNISTLWKMSSNLKPMKPNPVHMHHTEILAYDLVSGMKYEEISMPDGICTKFDNGEHTYAGTNTIAIILAMFYMKCTKEHEITVFMKNHQKRFEYYNYWKFKSHNRMLILAIDSITEIHHIPTPINPCIDRKEALQCEENCFLSKATKILECRLPFMKDITLPMCRNTTAARKARNIYLKNYELSPEDLENCKCIRPCDDVYYVYMSTEEPSIPKGATVLAVLYFNNRVVHYSEQLSYSIIKLLCDIGGNLGLTLGMSALTFIDNGQDIIIAIKKYIVRKLQ